MKKPVLFYQFDIDQFRKGQYEQGYFDYSNNPFGKCCGGLEGVMTELKKIIDNQYKCSDEFLKEHKRYFPYYDVYNSERIYREIKNI